MIFRVRMTSHVTCSRLISTVKYINTHICMYACVSIYTHTCIYVRDRSFLQKQKLKCDSVSDTVNCLFHALLLTRVHCEESLDWFEVSCFYYTVNARPSLGLLLCILLLHCVMETL